MSVEEHAKTAQEGAGSPEVDLVDADLHATDELAVTRTAAAGAHDEAPAPAAAGSDGEASNKDGHGSGSGTEQEQQEAHPQQAQQRTLHASFDAIKLGSLRLAAMIKQSAEALKASAQPAAASATIPAEGEEQEQANEHGAIEGSAAGGAGATTIAKIRGATATGLGAMARQTSRLYQTAAEGFKRLAVGDPLLALCRSEPHAPQLVLACCSVLVAGDGVRTEGIFKEMAPAEAVEHLSSSVVGTNHTKLIPPGTSPHVVASLLKRFLLGLQEPLLTYRMLPDWIAAAADVSQLGSLVAQMPAANANSLRLLLEVCHYVNLNAADTEMDALALAQALAPCVAWLPPAFKAPKAPAAGDTALAAAAATAGEEAPAPAAAAPGADAGGSSLKSIVPLEGDEAQAVILVLEALISKYTDVFV